MSRLGGLLAITVVLFILFALRGPELVSHFLANLSTATIKRELAVDKNLESPWLIGQAETLLNQATTISTNNRSAWRNKGFISAMQGQEKDALASWKKAGNMAPELIQWGHRAWESEDYREALAWYQRATAVDTQLSDAWYFLGLTWQKLGNEREALQAFNEAADQPALDKVKPSDIYFRLGGIHAVLKPEPDWSEVLRQTDEAVTLDNFSSEALEIRTHYLRAQALRSLGRERQALAEYEWVTARQPENYWANVHQGFLVWRLDKDPVKAEKAFRQALAVDNKNKWVYRGLGMVYQESDKSNKAIEMYQMVLNIDPKDTFALRQLDNLLDESE